MAALKFSTLVYFVLICTCFEVNSVISKESQLFKSYRLYWGVYTRAGVADSSRLVFYLRLQSNNQVDLIVFKLQSTSGRNMDKLFSCSREVVCV